MPGIRVYTYVAEHTNNSQCNVGWCGMNMARPGWVYPMKHSCGGLLHADFKHGDLDNVALNVKCDQCGFTETHKTTLCYLLVYPRPLSGDK